MPEQLKTNVLYNAKGQAVYLEDKEVSDKISSEGVDNFAELIDNKVDKVEGKGLSSNDFTDAEKAKLAGLEISDVGSLQSALNDKVDKVSGKGLSTEDFTTAEKQKLTTVYTSQEVDALLANKVSTSVVGEAGGVATLGDDGKVPSSQLPSYVDDVLEYANKTSFPETGEAGKIYVALNTNKTFRWGGSAYTPISESIALGETSGTAYEGDKGKANADAISAIKDGTTIDSFGDVETALGGKVDTETGKGLSSNDFTDALKTKLEGITDYDDTALAGRVSDIEDVVPSNASSSNKLITQADIQSGSNDKKIKIQDLFDEDENVYHPTAKRIYDISSDNSFTANAVQFAESEYFYRIKVKNLQTNEYLQTIFTEESNYNDCYIFPGSNEIREFDMSNEWKTEHVPTCMLLIRYGTQHFDLLFLGQKKNTCNEVGYAITQYFGLYNNDNNIYIYDENDNECECGIFVEPIPIKSEFDLQALYFGEDSVNSLIRKETDKKVDKVAGYGLSQENFSSTEKSKLASLEVHDSTKVDVVAGKSLVDDKVINLNNSTGFIDSGNKYTKIQYTLSYTAVGKFINIYTEDGCYVCVTNDGIISNLSQLDIEMKRVGNIIYLHTNFVFKAVVFAGWANPYSNVQTVTGSVSIAAISQSVYDEIVDDRNDAPNTSSIGYAKYLTLPGIDYSQLDPDKKWVLTVHTPTQSIDVQDLTDYFEDSRLDTLNMNQDGTYVLKCLKAGDSYSYAWVLES